jgi:uncharacterized protein DUF6285
MTGEKPSSRELVSAVKEFMETKVIPSVDKHTAFHARVAANVLATVDRELELGPELAIAEKERLTALLKTDGNRSALNKELCFRIRDKKIDLENPELIEHLYQTVMGRLSIDNPRYSAYLKALEVS